MFGLEYLPNKLPFQYAPTETTHWHQIVVSGYPVPCPIGKLRLRSVAAGNAANGGPFQVLFNQATTPIDAAVGEFVPAGENFETRTPPTSIYVKITAATDLIDGLLEY
jgi:hypothetical protein